MNEIEKQFYPKTHLWLLIPFFITILGFLFTYWISFRQAPFRHHVHGLTSTSWYLLLVIQPYLIKKKNILLHRNIGLISVFIAGGVVFSALQSIPFNLTSQVLSPILKYGLSFYDFVALGGFSYAVIMGVLNRHRIDKHARWMISTVFWALQPALARMTYFILLIANGGTELLPFIEVMFICMGATTLVILFMMTLDYVRNQMMYTSYLVVAICIPLVTAMTPIIGSADWWIYWCNNVLAKGLID